MINAFYLTMCVITMASTSILGAYYERHTLGKKDASPLFNLSRVITTLIFWCIIFIFDFSFDIGVLLYAVGFGASFAVSAIGLIYAIKYGSVALTSLFLQASLIGVTIWGLIFWGASFTALVVVGLILITVGLALCVLDKKNGATQKQNVSFRWFIFALMALAGNAGCTIFQKEQQLAYDGKHGSMLMVFALIFTTIVCLALYIKSDKSQSKEILKTEWPYAVGVGISNALINLFVILLATTTMSTSLIYPVIAFGGLLITTLFSLIVFKEKFKWWQWVGFLICSIAIVLLNI